MFEDWLYGDMTDFASALDYECEHPSWQVDHGLIKNTVFPVLTVELEDHVAPAYEVQVTLGVEE